MPTLLDALARHQLYLEGLKQSDVANFHVVLLSMEKELRRLLIDTRITSLDQLTKSKLILFISLLRRRQQAAYDAYQSRLLTFLQSFMIIDLDVTEKIYTAIVGKSALAADQEREHNSLYGAAFLRDPARLWGTVLNQPIPASGILPADLISGLTNTMALLGDNFIRKGYANSWTIDQALSELKGTKAAGFKDSAFVKFTAQAETITNTLLQHVSATAQAALSSLYFPTYRWVSVMDSVTTPICRERNNHIFKYIDGPQPPAHFNCRSKTVPITSEADANPPSFYAWVSAQPAEIQDDALGKTRADGLRAGRLRARDISKFERTDALTLKEFQQRVTRMLADA